MNNLMVPPHNLEAEQSVLGSLMLDNELFDIVSQELSEQEFYSRSHRLTYRVIENFITTGKPADLLTVEAELNLNGDIENAGGFVYLAEIIRNVPSTRNVQAYAKLVRECFVKRSILETSSQIQDLVYNSSEDSKEICAEAESKLSEITDRLMESCDTESITTIAQRFIDQVEQRFLSGKDITGTSTGLIDLDKKLSGFQAADLVILAARPSMGKTTLALNMVETEIRNDGFPLVFSLEMPSEKIFTKLVSSMGSIDIGNLQSANLSDEDWARLSSAMAEINSSNLEINDKSSITVNDLRLACRQYKKKKGNLTLIAVDYLQLMSGSNKENRTQEISEISRGLKSVAKEFNCPLIALSQLSRKLESRSDKRPINSDLRESGQIEQDADVILFIYRDEVYNKDSQDKGLAEVIIGKARMGEIGMVGTVFDGSKSRFRSLTGQNIVGHVEEERGFFV